MQSWAGSAPAAGLPWGRGVGGWEDAQQVAVFIVIGSNNSTAGESLSGLLGTCASLSRNCSEGRSQAVLDPLQCCRLTPLHVGPPHGLSICSVHWVF